MASNEQIKVEITAEYDDKGAKKAKTDLDALDGREAEATVDVDDNASRDIDKVDGKLDSIDGRNAEATLDVDDNATVTVEGVDAELDAIDGRQAEATLDVDDNASDDIDGAAGKLDGFDRTVDATLEATDHASGDIDRVAGKLLGVDRTTDATMEATDHASGDIDRVDSKLRNIDRTVDATVDVTTTDGTDTLISGVSGIGGKIAEWAPKLQNLAATGGPIAAVGAAFVAAGNEVADAALEAEKIAEAGGTSVEKASAFQTVLRDLTDIEAADLRDIMAQVTGALASNPALMTTLGINMDTIRQGPLATLVAAIDKWNSDQFTANERIKIGAELFGEEGLRQIGDLTTALDTDLQTAIDNVAESRIMSDEDVEAAREFKAGMREVSAEFNALTLQMGKDFLPLMAEAAELAGTIARNLFGESQEGTLFGGISPTDQEFLDTWGRLPHEQDEFNRRVEEGRGVLGDLAESFGVTSTEADGTVESFDAVAQSEAEMQAAIDESVSRLEAQRDAHQQVADAAEEQVDAMLSANDVFYANQEAVADAREAVADYEEMVADSNSTSADQRKALRDVAREADNLAQSEVDLARQQRSVEGDTLSATEALDIQNESLVAQAAQLDGPTQAAILGHIGRLNDIPEDVLTEILALINQGKLDEAEQLLNETSRTRTATMRADAENQSVTDVQRELDNLTKKRTVIVEVVYQGGSNTGIGGGGPIAAPSMVPVPAGGGDTYNLNLPRGTRADDTIRALDRHARRNGRRPYAFR